MRGEGCDGDLHPGTGEGARGDDECETRGCGRTDAHDDQGLGQLLTGASAPLRRHACCVAVPLSSLPHPYDALAPTVDDRCDLPAPALAEPFAFLEDELLPQGLAPVEPTSFGLACVQSAWGPRGPRN